MGNFIEVESNGVKILLNLNAVEYIAIGNPAYQNSTAVMLNGQEHIIQGSYQSFVTALTQEKS